MLSQGPNNPSSTQEDNSVGTHAWTNDNNVFSEDGSFAFSGFSAAGEQTFYLKVKGFGFNIPPQAVIRGILFEIKRASDGTVTVADNRIRIVKNDSIGSTDKANGSNWPVSAAFAYQSYGGSSDLWGETLLPSDINNSNFGIAISAKGTGVGVSFADIDHVRCTVYFDLPGDFGGSI